LFVPSLCGEDDNDKKKKRSEGVRAKKDGPDWWAAGRKMVAAGVRKPGQKRERERREARVGLEFLFCKSFPFETCFAI
jgi:hypothetical protein